MAWAIILSLGVYALMAGILFGSAGRWDLPMFWAYLGIMFAVSVIYLARFWRSGLDLIKERMQPGPGEQDHISVAVICITLTAQWVIAGLDVGRFHWSDQVSPALQIAGLLGYAAGVGLMAWATIINRFFSSAVRLQPDRGQFVVTSGPYRYVRHPGYSGGILFFWCGGLALGSWWSCLPVLLAIAAIIRRTGLEDRMLQQGLAGYAEYAGKVRYRLVPGIW